MSIQSETIFRKCSKAKFRRAFHHFARESASNGTGTVGDWELLLDPEEDPRARLGLWRTLGVMSKDWLRGPNASGMMASAGNHLRNDLFFLTVPIFR